MCFCLDRGVHFKGSIGKTGIEWTQIPVDANTTNYSLTPGLYLQDTVLIALPLSKSSTTYSTGDNYNDQSIGVLIKSLQMLSSGNAVSVTANLSQDRSDGSNVATETSRFAGFSGEYYFTRAFSLSAGLNVTDYSSGGDSKGYSIGGNWFFSPRVYAGMRLNKYSNSSNIDAENIGLKLGVRL